MKRNLLLTLAVLLGIGAAWGQTEKSTAKEWYYEVTNKVIPSYVIEKTYDRYYTDGDTIINDVECMIIRVERNLAVCDHLGESSFYIHQDGSSTLMYNKKTNEFTTLYNFDLNKGDSWEISIGYCTFAMVIDSIGNQAIGDVDRKVLYVSDEDDADHYSGMIVEGIGHLTSFFPRDISCEEEGFCDGLYETQIRCYYEDGEQVYNSIDMECDATYTITDVTQNIDKMPNKTIEATVINDYLVVVCNQDYSLGQYDIFDMSGRLINNGEMRRITNISIASFPQGIYLAKFTFNNNIKVIKFVKK